MFSSASNSFFLVLLISVCLVVSSLRVFLSLVQCSITLMIHVAPFFIILQRLVVHGVPEEHLQDLQSGLVGFVKSNKAVIPDLVSVILPSDEEVAEVILEARAGHRIAVPNPALEKLFHESMLWLEWLMFEGEPSTSLKNIAGQRGVCGAVWGENDIAFRCRTCEHDPTCAICVPCFQNGKHENHDYSIIYTGGGCCDCGDETAWKRDGFCSKHQGADKIQPLPEDIVSTVGPVLDAIFECWKSKLVRVESISMLNNRSEIGDVVNELTSALAEMLLYFCNHSESLLSFISRRLSTLPGLLDLLVRSERFLSDPVVVRLHELLLKLLRDPVFKYEFAKAFMSYYPIKIEGMIKNPQNFVVRRNNLHSTFAVQIFTVPALTLCLVKDVNLLAVLLECLGDVLLSCSGEDGRLQIDKWENLFDTSYRVLEDIKYVMGHPEAVQYVITEQQDLYRAWLSILSHLQGVNPLKRETSMHVEEEDENINLLFVFFHNITNINALLVAGAFSIAGGKDICKHTPSNTGKRDIHGGLARHAKVGRLSQESSACTSSCHSSGSETASQVAEMKPDDDHFLFVPSSISWLALECLRALDRWLGSVIFAASNVPAADGFPIDDFSAFKKALSRVKKGKYRFYGRRLVTNGVDDAPDLCTPTVQFHSSQPSDYSLAQQDIHPLDTTEMNIDNPQDLIGNDDSTASREATAENEAFYVLKSPDWSSIDYDVSCQEIAVHLPLHDFLSVILKEALGKYCMCVTPDMVGSSYANKDFFEQVLRGCHPYGFSSFVMEHPLRSRVFCAQVHAGMWRRNGEAALLYFDWSQRRLEFDLFLLQFCAALAPADLYVRRILERFGLLDYLSLDLHLYSEHEPVLVQEMLTLIIQIVKERRFCGFTASENLQRELVRKLASGDATHSKLVKSLPKDLSKTDQLQEILDAISQYSNPSEMNQGKYSLRPQYWKELDLYHLRWSPRDLQVAEDRYMHFCGVSALTKQLPKWTKIYQPLCGIARIATCRMVLQIIRAVLVYSVFTDESVQSRAPDVVLVTALHLLSLGLDICSVQKESDHQLFHDESLIPLLAFAGEEMHVESRGESSQQSLLSLLVLVTRIHKKGGQGYGEAGSLNLSSLVEGLLKRLAELDSGCMNKLLQFAPEVVDQLFQSLENKISASLGSNSDAEKRKAKARERQAAVLAKMRSQQSKFLATMKDSADNDLDGSRLSSSAAQDFENCAQDICSLCHDANSKVPISFLILLKKSKLVSFVERGPLLWDQDWLKYSNNVCRMANRMTDPSGSDVSAAHTETLSSPQLVQLFQAAIDDFSHHACAVEVDAFIDYFKMRIPELKHIHLPHKSCMAREKTVCSSVSLEHDMFLSIKKDITDIVSGSDITEVYKHCPRELERHSIDLDSALFGKYMAALTRESIDDSPLQNGRLRTSDSMSATLPYNGFGPSGCDGIHVSSCGHAVHQECLDRYLSSIKDRYARRIAFEGGHIVDPDQGEFLCPVCRRISNSILPLVPGGSQKLGNAHGVSSGNPLDSSKATTIAGTNPLRLQHALSLLGTAASVVSKSDILEVLPMQQNRRVKKNLEPLVRVLSGMYFPGKQDIFSKSGRASPSLIMWDILKYTIVSTEIAARCGKGATNSITCHSSLYAELKSSGGFVLPILLRIVQNTRSENLLDVLLRFKGIQLFAMSVFSGGNPNESSSDTYGGGNILRILKHIDADMMFLDTHFWNQAADPVLMQDPFSTFMWILFCLPYPVLSCKQSLLALVHIFYAVSVVQALIVYCGKSESSVDIGYRDCLLVDVFKLVRESCTLRQYFVINYPCLSDLKDAIKIMCLPFLRRCALLWELLSLSNSALFPIRVNGTSDVADKMDVCSSGMEYNEFSELEGMFEIPSMDVVLKDAFLRSLAPNWFHHFHKKFVHCRMQRVLHLTPCVPFQLMQLPYLYQDLVQRYVKPCCPLCKTVQEEPALCLLCGRVCSSGWKPCCRENSCPTHAMSCGAGTGVFLSIRRTTILLHSNARQAAWMSPYLDVFGEEDIGMHRGRPLYLNEERYAALTYMVASHGLDRNSMVLRQSLIGTIFMV